MGTGTAERQGVGATAVEARGARDTSNSLNTNKQVHPPPQISASWLRRRLQ